MRYAIFTDIHANLEALEAVLKRIDELAQEEPIDQIWFLGDLVGYGPNPNECIAILRTRTDVIIAGNHDWAAVGKLDLEDFSAAARISAEWTAEQLTEENREFLRNLPEHLEIANCTLVHGSPYGPLWEYLTSEVLAERSFQYFNSRYCVVGHTHVPVIFQQSDELTNEPTTQLGDLETALLNGSAENGKAAEDGEKTEQTEETAEMSAIVLTSQHASGAEDAPWESTIDLEMTAEQSAEESTEPANITDQPADTDESTAVEQVETAEDEGETLVFPEIAEKATAEEDIQNAEDRLNNEIEELLELLGLSQSMVKVTNEMLDPPEGPWKAPEEYRAIINPGGVGQPRDGDPRSAFMIYDSERNTFHFYRVEYPFEKTQEKIIEVGLPQYLAVRLGYGR
jgi:diadenosine tetraphosphatase ApaH/serine/threonine PP2A family protein phosphatase